MTNKEAIHALNHLYRNCSWNEFTCEEYGCDSCEDALNMAIEALATSQNLSEPINDLKGYELISRQAALDALHEEFYYELEDLKTAVDVIENLPSTQPEIIRCKDCKYWTHIKRTNRYWCKTDDGLYDLNPSPNDFCSRAERGSVV